MTVGHELSSRLICFPNTVIVLSASGESRNICRQCPARGDRNRRGATLRGGQHRRRAPLQVTRRSRRITRRSHLPRRAAVATAAAPCSCYGLSSMARWAPTLLPARRSVPMNAHSQWDTVLRKGAMGCGTAYERILSQEVHTRSFSPSL